MCPQLLPYIMSLSRVHLLSVKSYIADCSFQWHSFFLHGWKLAASLVKACWTWVNSLNFSRNLDSLMLYSDCLLHTYIKEIWPTVLMLTRASINIGMFSLHDHRFHTPQNKRVSHFHWWIVNDKNSWKRAIWFINK